MVTTLVRTQYEQYYTKNYSLSLTWRWLTLLAKPCRIFCVVHLLYHITKQYNAISSRGQESSPITIYRFDPFLIAEITNKQAIIDTTLTTDDGMRKVDQLNLSHLLLVFSSELVVWVQLLPPCLKAWLHCFLKATTALFKTFKLDQKPS